jgi:prepilin-type N-terminal cleavage/methylation domain-containing protein
MLKNNKGFTIIEVLIVLAIAGVIMLVVFLAVPQLQRNSRNTQRTSDASLIAAGINECLTNRNGTVTSCDSATEVALDTSKIRVLNSPAPAYDASVTTVSSTTTAVWRFGVICTSDGASATTTGANARSFVVLYAAEGSSGAVTRCVDA